MLFLAVTVSAFFGCYLGITRLEDAPIVDPEFPNGDANVPPELGGPGFTGKGWTTAQPEPLGDPRAAKGGGLQMAIYDWPDNLRMYGTGSNTYLNSMLETLCYESLCRLHPETLEPVPQLATHWQITDDQMTFRFRINPKAHWSDGNPVTAEDVRATWHLVMDETLIDPMRRQSFSKMEEPVVESKYIVKIRCKAKDWRNFLTISGAAILPAHEIGDIRGRDYLDRYNFSFTANSGPYVVLPSGLRENHSVTAVRRLNYWGRNEAFNQGLYNFDRIRYRVITDHRLAFEKALKGELHFHPIYTAKWWVEDIIGEDGESPVDAIRKGHLVAQKIFTKNPQGVQGMAFNMRKPPLDDVRVRKALAHLYDRRTMLEKFAYNEYTPSKSYFPSGDYENPENKMVEFDPEEADRLLNGAGWSKRGSDGIRLKDGSRLSLTLLYRSAGFTKYLSSFKESCRDAGVEIELELTDPAAHWKGMMERSFQIAGMAWTGSLFPDPKSNWKSAMAAEPGSNNICGFKDKEVDRVIEEYDACFDQKKRAELLRRLDALLYNEHPYALDWYIPCERMIYWNRFGMPKAGLSKYADFREVVSSWWVDPEKVARLKEARKTGATIPDIPLRELRPWEGQVAERAAD